MMHKYTKLRKKKITKIKWMCAKRKRVMEIMKANVKSKLFTQDSAIQWVVRQRRKKNQESILKLVWLNDTLRFKPSTFGKSCLVPCRLELTRRSTLPLWLKTCVSEENKNKMLSHKEKWKYMMPWNTCIQT